jgi:hypothetical protein
VPAASTLAELDGAEAVGFTEGEHMYAEAGAMGLWPLQIPVHWSKHLVLASAVAADMVRAKRVTTTAATF